LIHDSKQKHLALQFNIIQTKTGHVLQQTSKYYQYIPTGENRIATEGNRRIKYNRLTHLNLSRLGEFFVSNKWDTTFLLRNSKQTSMISISDTVAHYS
jgi:glycogen debranching enzyme